MCVVLMPRCPQFLHGWPYCALTSFLLGHFAQPHPTGYDLSIVAVRLQVPFPCRPMTSTNAFSKANSTVFTVEVGGPSQCRFANPV